MKSYRLETLSNHITTINKVMSIIKRIRGFKTSFSTAVLNTELKLKFCSFCFQLEKKARRKISQRTQLC